MNKLFSLRANPEITPGHKLPKVSAGSWQVNKGGVECENWLILMIDLFVMPILSCCNSLFAQVQNTSTNFSFDPAVPG